MPPAEGPNKPSLLSLHEDLLHKIGSLLDDKGVCGLELASRTLNTVASRLNGPGPCKRSMELSYYGMITKSPGSIGPAAARWRLKRVQRYSHIPCHVYAEMMLEGSNSLAKRPAQRTVPYALPTLLAACDPSAELDLSVTPGLGDAFLALSLGCSIPGAAPELTSFWPNVQQQLTKLTLELYPAGAVKGHVQDMGALATLTALRELEVWCIVPSAWRDDPEWSDEPPTLRSMSAERLILKLPHLHVLRLHYLKHGEVVLMCPRLTEARFEETNSFRIEVHEAALERLELVDCRRVQCMIRSPEDQLQSLKHLIVVGCSERCHRLIESLDHMRQLETLIYKGFPKACRPTKLPFGLRKCEVNPIDRERGCARYV